MRLGFQTPTPMHSPTETKGPSFSAETLYGGLRRGRRCDWTSRPRHQCTLLQKQKAPAFHLRLCMVAFVEGDDATGLPDPDTNAFPCRNKKAPAFQLRLHIMVGEEGFEPPTLWSQTRCATKLRYSPTCFCYDMNHNGSKAPK